MRVALRKHDRVAGDELHRRLAADLDVALALGDQVEDDDALGAGLEQRRRGVGARRLVAPRRGEPRLDEDRADQAHDAQRFATAHPSAASRLSMCNVDRRRVLDRARHRRAAIALLDQRAQRSAGTPCAAIRTCSCTSLRSRAASACRRHSVMPSRPRVSERLLARTSSAGELDAARRGAHRDARRRARCKAGAEQPARRHPVAAAAQLAGHVGRDFAAVGVTGDDRVLPRQRAVAGASSCRPMSGRRRSTISTRSMASATYCADMLISPRSSGAIVGASGPCA